MSNRYSPTVIAAAITSRQDKAQLPTHIKVSADNCGLIKDSIVLLEQIRTISKDRLDNYVGKLSRGQLEALWRALAISMGETGGKDNNIIMCLCKRCADNFRAMGKYKLRCVAKEQKKDTCTYCNYRQGFEYELVPKE